MDADTGYIVASILTERDVDDPSQVGPLLDQIEHEIGQVMADGAYDGEPTYETIAQRDPQIEVVIPPRVTAQPSAQFEVDPTRRYTQGSGRAVQIVGSKSDTFGLSDGGSVIAGAAKGAPVRKPCLRSRPPSSDTT